MTTPAAERLYAAQNMMKWGDKGYASYNPNGVPLEDLPVIYGFNNGGSPGWYSACLIAEDGTGLGGHCCSHECYMPYDLGIVEGLRPDRHQGFREHYPNGYRMEFVSFDDVLNTPPLVAAFELNKALAEAASGMEAATAGETTEIGSTEGDSPTAESGDVQND